jgi:hypothetical protein
MLYTWQSSYHFESTDEHSIIPASTILPHVSTVQDEAAFIVKNPYKSLNCYTLRDIQSYYPTLFLITDLEYV